MKSTPEILLELPPLAPATQNPYHAVIRVYDEAGNVIETHERKGDFKEW